MYKKGTIILTPFPFVDLSTSKVRPALILSKKPVNNYVTIAFISSQVSGKRPKGEMFLPIKSDVKNGLKMDSVIVCSKIATLDKRVVLGEMGKASRSIMKKVDYSLKKYFEL